MLSADDLRAGHRGRLATHGGFGAAVSRDVPQLVVGQTISGLGQRVAAGS